MEVPIQLHHVILHTGIMWCGTSVSIWRQFGMYLHGYFLVYLYILVLGMGQDQQAEWLTRDYSTTPLWHI